MTGMRPDQIKVYDLDAHFRDAVPDAVTLPQRFIAEGYFVARVGKIYHYNVPASIGTDGFDDPPSWQRTINPKGRDKTDEAMVFNAEPHRKISGALSWLAAEGEDEEQTDGMVATAAIKLMEEHQGEAFFIAAGFFRPHTPFVAPKKYFDMYPIEEMRLPYTPVGDRDDIPTAAFAHNNPVPNYGLDKLTCAKLSRPTTPASRSSMPRSGGCWTPSSARARGEDHRRILERPRLPPRRTRRGLAEAHDVRSSARARRSSSARRGKRERPGLRQHRRVHRYLPDRHSISPALGQADQARRAAA